MSGPDKIVHEPQPRAKRLRTADLHSLVARDAVQVLGVDGPTPTIATTAKTVGVVELPAPPSVAPTLAEVIADAVLAKLTATGAVAQFAPDAKRIVGSNADSRKPRYVDLAEAAIRLGTTKGAMKKYLARHQRRDGRDTVCVLGAGARAVKVRGRWRVRFDDEARP